MTVGDQIEDFTIVEEKLIHIDLIRPGDLIIHTDGILRTVCGSNIKRGGFHGTSIFGDSYHSGYKPVRLVKVARTRR
jgi:hypothetical protein